MRGLVGDFMEAKLISDLEIKKVKKARLYLVRGTRKTDYEIVCAEIDEIKKQITILKNED